MAGRKTRNLHDVLARELARLDTRITFKKAQCSALEISRSEIVTAINSIAKRTAKPESQA